MYSKDVISNMLVIACQEGYIEILEYLVKHVGIDVNIRINDYTLLYYACFYDKLSIVKYLIECGADINATAGENNATPLMHAISMDHVDIVQYLVQYHDSKGNYAGANIHATDKNRDTPLHYAMSTHCNYDIVNLLIKHNYAINTVSNNMFINALNNDLLTPLHCAFVYAFGKRHIETMCLLIDNGADPNIKCKNGTTAWNAITSCGVKMNKLILYIQDSSTK